MRIAGANLDSLRAIAERVAEVMRATPGTQYVRNPVALARTDLAIQVDRQQAGLLGVATAELDRILGPSTDVKLPPDLKGKIVVVDPKWDFVVLNIGDDRGVLQDGELLVSRNGKLVAKVVVRSVQKDRCVANVIPGWKLGEMIEGDDVTPAHPAS